VSPSQQCKAAGLRSLKQLSEVCGESEHTLYNWHKNRPKVFAMLIVAALLEFED